MKKAFIAGVIITVIRAVGRLVGKLVDLGSKLSDMSAQTGVAVDNLQKLDDAARNAGSSSQKMAKALVSLKDAQGEVLDGDKLMTDAFNNLGISIEEVASLSTDDLFVRVAKALTESGNSAKELSAVFDVLGKRNAMELTEAMNEVAGGLDNIEKKSSALTNAEAQRLDILADMWANLKHSAASSASATFASLLGLNKAIEKEVAKREKSLREMTKREKESRAFDLAQLKAENY